MRTDAGHLSIYFSTACVLWIAIPWSRRRWPVLLAGIAVIAALGIPVRPPGMPTNLDLVANVRAAGDQLRNLFSGSRRARLIDEGRAGMQSVYALDPAMLAELRGRSVAIEPWEIGAAWAYELDWRPLPVFQNYSAYTADARPAQRRRGREPGRAAADPAREPAGGAARVPDTRDLDNRYPRLGPAGAGAGDPLQLRAAGDRRALAGPRARPRPLRPTALARLGRGAAEGEAVEVPAPRPGEVVFAQVEGVGVGGLERLTTLLLPRPPAHAILDDGVQLPARPGNRRRRPAAARRPADRRRAGLLLADPADRHDRDRGRRWRAALRLLRRAGQRSRPESAVSARLTPSLAPIPA